MINSVSFFKLILSYLISHCLSFSIAASYSVYHWRFKGLFLCFRLLIHFLFNVQCWWGRQQENEWWVESKLLFDLTTIILLAGSDLVSPWLVSIQWPVITIPKEFPLYVPLSFSLQPATAGSLMKKTQTDLVHSVCRQNMLMEKEQRRLLFSYVHHLRFQRLGSVSLLIKQPLKL